MPSWQPPYVARRSVIAVGDDALTSMSVDNDAGEKRNATPSPTKTSAEIAVTMSASFTEDDLDLQVGCRLTG